MPIDETEKLQESANRPEGMTAMDMQPVVVGPGSYSSPDPDTEAARLVPLSEHPSAESISEDYGADAMAAGDDDGSGEAKAATEENGDEISALTVAELDDQYGDEEGYPTDGKKSDKVAFAREHEGSN
jgi:hypothetical protein